MERHQAHHPELAALPAWTTGEKVAADYLAFVKLACIRLWLRFYEFTAIVRW